jgi:hypothetical protein
VWAIIAIGVFCCFLVVLTVFCYRRHCQPKPRVDAAAEATTPQENALPVVII